MMVTPATGTERLGIQRSLHLGPVLVDLRANRCAGLPDRYFSPSALNKATPTESDFDLQLFETDVPVKKDASSYRSRLMAKGFYISEHCGPPVSIAWDAWRRCILTGANLGEVVWRYFTKMALSLQAIRRGQVHLKGTAIGSSSGGVLITGGGTTSAGLVAMNTNADLQWVSNTHVLLDGRTAYGVDSKLRVRPDSYRLLPDGLRLSPEREIYVSPEILFGRERVRDSVKLKAVLYRANVTGGKLSLTRFEDPTALAPFWEQYVCAVRRYDIEPELYEDVCKGDARRFASMVKGQSLGLGRLLDEIPVYCLQGSLYNVEAPRELTLPLDNLLA
jgi:hypothetical protein